MPASRPTIVRFWEKVDRAGPEGCWLWTACLRNGYGTLVIDGRKEYAHRFAYELLVGPIPDGLQLDHVRARCAHRHCVNPAHLEPVTQAENMRRGGVRLAAIAARVAKTHCPSGHPYAGDNLYIAPRGDRQCRTCKRTTDRRRRGSRSPTT